MMQPMVFRLSDEDRRLLAIEAHRRGVSVAEVGRHAIKRYLAKNPKQESGVEILLRWAKRKEKTTKKIEVNSTNYKQYLYGPKSVKFGYLWEKKK